MRTSGKFIPVKEAWQNPDVLKNIRIITDPWEFHFNHRLMANAEILICGCAAAGLPTSEKNVFKAIYLKRKRISIEEAASIIHVINFYVDYQTAWWARDKATMERMDIVANQFALQSDDCSRCGIHRLTGVKWYVNNLVCSEASISKYTAPGSDRAKLANVPFIKIDVQHETITWSRQRTLDHLKEDESIDAKVEDGNLNLQKAGIYRQALMISGKPNPDNGFFLEKFEKFLLERPKYFHEYKRLEIKTAFKIPLLTKVGSDYIVLDKPTITTNSGTSYHDYMLNNLETDTPEQLIYQADGSISYSYFEALDQTEVGGDLINKAGEWEENDETNDEYHQWEDFELIEKGSHTTTLTMHPDDLFDYEYGNDTGFCDACQMSPCMCSDREKSSTIHDY